MIEWRIHDDADAMAKAVSNDVAGVIADALARQGHAAIALPGGKTPIAVIALLAQLPLDWAKVTIIPGDDRLVEEESPLSNVAMLRTAFQPTPAKIISLTPVIEEYRLAGDRADALLATLDWPLDLVWLGMGNDGHTASIFAGPDLEALLHAPADRRVMGVMPDPLPPEAPVARVTLTRSAIAASHAIRVVISGAEKRILLERALAEGAASALPIGRVLAGLEQPLIVHWCL
ncbi:6-phosphogluconolactonase [Aquisediminimonas sediminicola]|uniref:6-phosphogluconolactonase n=1 Tax=Alteraquisediminimonas sediminicola TaxID=2676787 RepID=UPI001C8DADAF|nr:6-phosphogluconolactonase [Aquisediminimonas sediminicola]